MARNRAAIGRQDQCPINRQRRVGAYDAPRWNIRDNHLLTQRMAPKKRLRGYARQNFAYDATVDREKLRLCAARARQGGSWMSLPGANAFRTGSINISDIFFVHKKSNPLDSVQR